MLQQRSQLGLSLIELLVAMAISSFLILGITQIYIDNKRSYAFQQSQGENQENGRYAIMTLEQQLNKTGFRRRPDEAIETVFPAATVSGCTFTSGQVINRVDAKTLCIRYQPRDTQELDCLGTGVSSGTAAEIATPYTSTSGVFAMKISVDTTGKLTCQSGTTTGTLLEGIEDVKFDFGVGPASSRDVTSFTATPGATDVIRAVRFSLLMVSSQTGVSQGISSKVYTDWYGSTATQPTTGKLYQIASSTSALRNVMP